MTTLDNPKDGIEPASTPVWPSALRYGGIAGVINGVLALIRHFAGFDDSSTASTDGAMIGCLSWLIIIAGTVLAIIAHRDKDLGGFISYGRALGIGTATSLVMGGIGAVWMLLMHYVIAPGNAELVREAMLEQAQPGQEEIMETMAGLMTNPSVLFVATILGTVFIGFIISLIAGAILKNERRPV